MFYFLNNPDNLPFDLALIYAGIRIDLAVKRATSGSKSLYLAEEYFMGLLPAPVFSATVLIRSSQA